jgi:hypothetical protein
MIKRSERSPAAREAAFRRHAAATGVATMALHIAANAVVHLPEIRATHQSLDRAMGLIPLAALTSTAVRLVHSATHLGSQLRDPERPKKEVVGESLTRAVLDIAPFIVIAGVDRFAKGAAPGLKIMLHSGAAAILPIYDLFKRPKKPLPLA